MKAKYEVYTCNEGNPTVIFNQDMTIEDCERLATVTYQNMQVIDQGGLISDVNDNECSFMLTGGEFCGNACTSAAAHMYRNYGVTEGTIHYNLIDDYGKREVIDVKFKTDGKMCDLDVPKKALLQYVSKTKAGYYLVVMNGISHVIIPTTKQQNNRKEGLRIRDELIKSKEMPEVFGIIFLYKNSIDPFIWIPVVDMFQNQRSCLSGSVAAATYLMEQSKQKQIQISQPTGLSYTIEIQDDIIKLRGKIDLMVRGEVEIDEQNNSRISKVDE